MNYCLKQYNPMIFSVRNIPEECLKVIAKINSLRENLRFLISDNHTRWPLVLRRSSLARAVQGTNSIEGYNVTYEDAVAAVDGEEPLDAQKEDWLAAQGTTRAMNHILQIAADPAFVFDLGTIRGLQFMMIEHDINKHPGRWRPGAIWVKHEPEGTIVYEAPDVELVPGLMNEFVESLNAKDDLPVMVRAALAHINLAMIHPFSDGNGRMGRAIQTLVLGRERVVDPVFSSIDAYIGRHRNDYYAILAEVGQGSWHPENSPLPFIKFCLVAHYREAEKLFTLAKQMGLVWAALDNLIKEQKLHPRTMAALADATIGIRVRNSGYRQSLKGSQSIEISEQSALKDLKSLVDKGLLIAKGERRSRYYLAGDPLLKIKEDLIKPSVEPDSFLEIAAQMRPDLPGIEPHAA